MDRDAVWGGEWSRARKGVLDFGGDRRRERGQLGDDYNAEMAYRSIIDSCVKSWQYFPTQNVAWNSVNEWLSYDVVRFKIELGFEEKFICKNVTKQTLQLWLCRCRRPAGRHVLAVAQGRSRCS